MPPVSAIPSAAVIEEKRCGVWGITISHRGCTDSGASNATGRDGQTGNIPEDLYYRLSGFVIDIPPAERKEDIPLLAQYFRENAEQYDFAPSSQPGSDRGATQLSLARQCTELKTVIDRAVAFADGSMVTKKNLIFDRSFTMNLIPMPVNGTNGNGTMLGTPFYTAVENFEKCYLSELLEAAEGNISQASQISGASRKTIREKGKKYGLL